jgi:3-oxoacyl-[acyl-carrier-protein] synthase II
MSLALPTGDLESAALKDVGIYGWGIVAPRSPDIETFARNLESNESWLAPFQGFGPSNFLVGTPEFDFERYRPWIEARFPANRFSQLVSKMDPTTLYAVGAFLQSLEQNSAMEGLLRELGTEAHVYVGTGLGAIPTIYDASLDYARGIRDWNRFWTAPERNAAMAAYLADPQGARRADPLIPEDPARTSDPEDAADQRLSWYAFWAARSDGLARFLAELAEVEAVSIGGEVEGGKIRAIREKERNKSRLLERWGAPTPPWNAVSTNVLWNIHNTPASQISMLGHITGLAYAPVAACSTFSVCLKLGMDAIDRGEAKVVVVGATDPAPHPLTVGAFYGARVLSADGQPSLPLTGLRGTHVSGGAVVWILGDREFMEARGMKALGMQPVAVGVSSDADHIITPSKEGPTEAIRQALELAGIEPKELASWDLHATATPGDYLEVETLRDTIPETVLVTARKGTFGHGMGAGGGWELTAQYLGVERGVLFPTPLTTESLNAEIGSVHDQWVFQSSCPTSPAPVGKLSMGVGGVNACVVSRPL